jgi:hypothetical protein
MSTAFLKDNVLEAVDSGWIDRDFLILCFVKWLPVDELNQVLIDNEIDLPPENYPYNEE